MGFARVSNVRCEIRDGRAYLSSGERNARTCHGSCSACASFLGVDIRQVGQTYLDGDCSESPFMDTQVPGAGLTAGGSELQAR